MSEERTKRQGNSYRGLSYPNFLLRFDWQQRLWKRFFCLREIHLFDEVWSIDDHYLYCDACSLSIHIDRIENPIDVIACDNKV